MSTEYAVIGVFIISIVLGYILHLLCKKIVCLIKILL